MFSSKHPRNGHCYFILKVKETESREMIKVPIASK
jgi:hypothetical protein